MIKSTKQQLCTLPLSLGYIEGIRPYHKPSILTSSNPEKREWSELIKGEITYDEDADVIVGILDSGVNNAHELLISIIVPCYNVGCYLHQCVASLVSQTYKILKLFLLMMGLLMIQESFVMNTEKRRTHKSYPQANGGLVSARNAGYEAATGDWFCFIDGDDWLDVDMMEKIVHQLGNHADIDVVFWKLVHEVNGHQILVS